MNENMLFNESKPGLATSRGGGEVAGILPVCVSDVRADRTTTKESDRIG